MWIGYWGGGLDYYNRKTGTFKHYRHNPNNPRSISEDNIYSIFEDSKKNIWFGTWSKGVSRYNKETDDFTHFTHDPLNPNSIGSAGGISWIEEDHLGNIWIAMEMTVGLSRYNPATGTFTHFKAEEKEGDISNNSVFVVFEDSKHRLWVGTNGGGLNLFDHKNQKFKAFRINDGLPSETITGIVEDDKNNIWLSTFNGLSMFNPEKMIFKNFSSIDGLQSQQFNRWSFLKLSNGEVLFGGVNGFNLFNPEHIKENAYIPPVYITDFKLFNRNVNIGEKELFKQDIFLTKELNLQYNQNFVSFELTALNYTQSEKNQYQYKLEGLQEDWVEAGSERKVFFTNLDRGHYIFKVKASNNDGLWNKEDAQLSITIIPPYWKTWWFRTLSIFFVVGCAIMWYHQRIKNIKEQKLILEQQVQERTAEVVLQKEEISAQAEYLKDAYHEIVKHEKKVNELYSEVKDSIRAAQVIQESLLPSINFIRKHLPESFIYYNPKDVVSGDFYWFDIVEDNLIIACADCTGHGVSGAFMSINGHHLLKQAISSNKILEAATILNKLNEGIVNELNKQEKDNKIYDGMDIALCILNKENMKMQYAGANNPLYLVRNKEIIQVKANKYAIGISYNAQIKSFTNHEINLQKNDVVYLFSDGYVDQLGGEDGQEKFMYNRFRELLIEISLKPFQEQEDILKKVFQTWKKDQEQMDDILVMGFKV